jgi:ferric-dicitrate binding protein FerR (iron transport regulator)
MSKQDFIELYEKYLSGQCTAAEKELLESYYSEIKLMDNEWEAKLGDEQLIRNMIRAQIGEATGIKEQNVLGRSRIYTSLKYAAAVLVFTTAGVASWLYFTQKSKLQQGTNSISAVIKPGSHSATLTLANGKSILLNATKNGQISQSSGVAVKKQSDSVLTYTYAGDKRRETSAIPDSNILTIPRGGIIQTVLSDGTRVWINSASSLKYPVAFAGTERRVVLSGEAYFEVTKNKQMPFKVVVNGVEVQVLGTHFNVMGYHEDKVIKTTLLEGSVKLRSAGSQTLLKPGQEGIFADGQSRFNVNEVNATDAIAWKEGFIVFDNESIQNIMLKIARWYNVDVVYKGKMNKSNFGGTISRYKSIDVVLKALETTGSVHFKIEGRRIIVMA